MLEIYVWPDGDWMFKEDYCENEYRYKSDDFLSMFVEEASDDDEIDRLVAEALGNWEDSIGVVDIKLRLTAVQAT